MAEQSASTRKLRAPRKPQNRAQPPGSQAALEIEPPSCPKVSTDFPSPQTTENGNALASPSDDCLSNITVPLSSDESDRSESPNLGHQQTTNSRKRNLPDDATSRADKTNHKRIRLASSASPIIVPSETFKEKKIESICEKKADRSKSWLEGTPPVSDFAWKTFEGDAWVSHHAIYDVLNICSCEDIVLINTDTAIPLVRRLQIEMRSGYTGLVIALITIKDHLTVAVGDVQSHQIRFYNSLKNISTVIKKALDTLNNESQVTWTLHNIACEQQNDDTDCGLCLCWIALRELARKAYPNDVNVQLCRWIYIVLFGGESRSFAEHSYPMKPKEIEEAIDILQHFHDDLVKRQERLQEVQLALTDSKQQYDALQERFREVQSALTNGHEQYITLQTFLEPPNRPQSLYSTKPKQPADPQRQESPPFSTSTPGWKDGLERDSRHCQQAMIGTKQRLARLSTTLKSLKIVWLEDRIAKLRAAITEMEERVAEDERAYLGLTSGQLTEIVPSGTTLIPVSNIGTRADRHLARRHSEDDVRRMTRATTKRARSPSLGSDQVREDDKYSVKHGLGEPWDEPIVYPFKGTRRTTVEQHDLIRLDEGEFLNDSIIEFYIRWLWEKLNVSEQQVYIFSTHFYTTLTRNKFNYLAVERWTAKVDIFSRDFAVIPINQALHWYLAIVCNLPKLRKIEPEDSDVVEAQLTSSTADELIELADTDFMTIDDDGDARESIGEEPGLPSYARHETPTAQLAPESQSTQVSEIGIFADVKISPHMNKKTKRKSGPSPQKCNTNQPAIVLLDSLSGTHSATIRNIKDYLIEEGKSKRGLDISRDELQGIHAREGVPKQNNFSDCGLYVLGYLHKFLEDPKHFGRKLMAQEFDLQTDWPNMIPSAMRDNIRRELFNIYAEQKAERYARRRAKKAAKRAHKMAVQSDA